MGEHRFSGSTQHTLPVAERRNLAADRSGWLSGRVRGSLRVGTSVADAALGAFSRLGAGMAALVVGDPVAAAENFAVGRKVAGVARGVAEMFGGPAAEAALAIGDVAGARTLAQQTLVGCADERLPWQEACARLALARVARADGDPGRAEDLAQGALTLCQDIGAVGGCADGLELLAGIATSTGRPAEAARLFAAAAAARDRAGGRRWGVHSGTVDEIEGACGMLGPQFEEAWAAGTALSLDEAIAYAARGRGERGRPTSGWESLTPTERQVVVLVAEGLANRQIGERMFISPRTVQTHLTHAYAKLAVTGRVALVHEVARHREQP